MNLMHWLLCLLGSFIWATTANVPQSTKHADDWDLDKPINGLTFQRIKAVVEPTRDVPTKYFSRLRATKGDAVGDASTQYAIQCSWDDTPIWLLFDTGSSDTWAAKSDFECSDGTGLTHGQSACGFGHPYIPDFLHGEVPDLHFSLRYGSGEYISGPMGLSDISCGGVSVSKQQVGLANSTYWHGNNVTVGILGLAYPSITSAYYGQIGHEAPWNAVTYTPFLTKAISQGEMKPVFSVGLMKNGSDGANLIGQEETSWKYSFYTIVPDGMRWDMTTDETKYPYIIDTGTTMMYLPPPLAEAIAMAFQPRAVYLYQWDTYFAPCDTVPPRFAVVISGIEFWINSADLVFRDLVDPLTGYCAIGIASGGSGPYILGDVFLQNVLAVFDIGAAEMRFYARD
ncbi:putative aspartic-type endopeptidase [Cladobotryum mycophilum]|uniref:Aspartic-type endopeptidase n=1 Tax=Cladobotryum mycophilum TaxID=491253 RepID=A0ABR0S914_9HYPO